MASRLIPILRIFGPRAAKTADHTNSWATISLWRRFFQLKDEEEQEEHSMMEEFYNSIFTSEKLRPIASDSAREMRRQEMQAAHIQATQPAARTAHREPQQQYDRRETMRRVQEQRILERPNLSIPVEGNYTTLAQ